jgi:hypothetical protein
MMSAISRAQRLKDTRKQKQKLGGLRASAPTQKQEQGRCFYF